MQGMPQMISARPLRFSSLLRGSADNSIKLVSEIKIIFFNMLCPLVFVRVASNVLSHF